VDDLADILTKLRETVDGIILVGNIHPLTIQRLVLSNPQLTIVISSFDGEATPVRYGYLGDTFVLIWPGDEGASVEEIRISRAKKITVDEVVFHRMDDSIGDELTIKRDLDAVFSSERFLGATEASSVASSSQRPGSVTTDGRQLAYVGSSSCRDCHEPQFRQWRRTSHASAMRTLIGRRRNRHPGCISCHVVGFGTISGYNLRVRQRDLENVGCESCHGPGSLHMVEPASGHISRSVSREVCSGCHTAEHSMMADNPRPYFEKITH
jgi:hypothetical protein